MRPQRLSGGGRKPFRTDGVVHTAAAVFDRETRATPTLRVQTGGKAGALPKTREIVDHLRDDIHSVIDVAAKLAGAVAGAIDQVAARRRIQTLGPLTPMGRGKTVVR